VSTCWLEGGGGGREHMFCQACVVDSKRLRVPVSPPCLQSTCREPEITATLAAECSAAVAGPGVCGWPQQAAKLLFGLQRDPTHCFYRSRKVLLFCVVVWVLAQPGASCVQA
jgi:hypothetical protein